MWRRCLLAMLVFSFWGGAAPVQGWFIWSPVLPPDPGPVNPMEVLREYPLLSGSLSLPGVPESGVVELDAAETTPFVVRLTGQGPPYGGTRTYTWSTDHSLEGFGYMEGGVYLRWFWNGKRCAPFSDWIKDGNPGKGGTYRVELWQSMVYRQTGQTYVSENVVRIGTDTYRSYRQMGSTTFEVVIRGHTPLAAGALPQFTEVPDLPPLPATTVVPEAG